MKACRVLLLWLGISTSVFAVGLPDYSLHYDAGRDPFVDGRAAIALAKKTNRRILIMLGGDWCLWCRKLDRFFNSYPNIKKSLHETFVVLKVNVSDDNDNHEFLKVFPPALGYPHMYVTESNGKLLKSKDTAEFLQNGRYSLQKFQQFFKRWKKP